MKKVMLLIGLVCLLGMNFGCSKVPSGNVGVKVHLLGGAKGVDSETLGPGRYWIGWNEELHLFPTFMQNYVYTASPHEGKKIDESITFQTSEGVAINGDYGISYTVDPEKVSLLFQTFRQGLEEITDSYLRNTVRDALVEVGSHYKVEEVVGAKKGELVDIAEKKIQDRVAPLGIKFEKLSPVGVMRLPDNIVKALNDKIMAIQDAEKAENQKREATAEAAKKIEEAKGKAESIKLTAIAQAEANKILSQSLTIPLVQYKMIEKWDGMMPRITGGGNQMLDVSKVLEK